MAHAVADGSGAPTHVASAPTAHACWRPKTRPLPHRARPNQASRPSRASHCRSWRCTTWTRASLPFWRTQPPSRPCWTSSVGPRAMASLVNRNTQPSRSHWPLYRIAGTVIPARRANLESPDNVRCPSESVGCSSVTGRSRPMHRPRSEKDPMGGERGDNDQLELWPTEALGDAKAETGKDGERPRRHRSDGPTAGPGLRWSKPAGTSVPTSETEPTTTHIDTFGCGPSSRSLTTSMSPETPSSHGGRTATDRRRTRSASTRVGRPNKSGRGLTSSGSRRTRSPMTHSLPPSMHAQIAAVAHVGRRGPSSGSREGRRRNPPLRRGSDGCAQLFSGRIDGRSSRPACRLCDGARRGRTWRRRQRSR